MASERRAGSIEQTGGVGAWQSYDCRNCLISDWSTYLGVGTRFGGSGRSEKPSKRAFDKDKFCLGGFLVIFSIWVPELDLSLGNSMIHAGLFLPIRRRVEAGLGRMG